MNPNDFKSLLMASIETARLGPPATLVARVLRDVSNDVLTDVTDVLEVACAEKFLDLSVDVVGVMMRNLR